MAKKAQDNRIYDFERSIGGLDLALFETIPSQSTDDDRRSLLACQLATRELCGEYNYLEIGSYLGGSIQPHLLDPRCRSILSIDKRPPSQPDERGFDWIYRNNSTERMLEALRGVSKDLSKLKTIDGDTRRIDPALVADEIQLCFIDGEHTDDAAFADFKFCYEVMGDNGAVLFHDSHITYNGITDSLELLRSRNIEHTAYVLPNVLFVIEIGEFPLHRHPMIAQMLAANHKSYLFALRENDNYRRFANRFPFGAMRRMMLRFRGGNISE